MVFDLGGVVFRYAPELRWRGFARVTGLSADAVRKRLQDSGYSRACDLGRLRGERAYAEAVRLLGKRISMERFAELWVSVFSPNDEVVELVRQAKRRCAVALLTNNSDVVRTGLEARHGEIMDLFRPQLFSCDLGLSKPDPRAFSAALDLLGTEASQTALIDDSAANTDTAAALGLETHLYRSPAELAEALACWGLL